MNRRINIRVTPEQYDDLAYVAEHLHTTITGLAAGITIQALPDLMKLAKIADTSDPKRQKRLIKEHLENLQRQLN